MDRRTYLRSLGVAGVGGLAGCLDAVGFGDGGDDRTILGPPEENHGNPIHPVYGDEFPSFSIPAPLRGETVSLDDFLGERAFLMTYFFTACPDGACPALLLRLRRVQADAAERGYDDDIALLAMTFDPERDTPETLEEYGHQQGVDYEAGNWWFLRPETYEEAETLMTETFGSPFERVEEDDQDATDEGDEPDGNDGDDDREGDEATPDGEDHGDDDHDHGDYTFTHYNLIVLVNEQGIVERAYPNAIQDREAVSVETIVEETRTVATE